MLTPNTRSTPYPRGPLEHRDQPGRLVLAVECDGERYHGSESVRDRDRLRQEHLERLAWRFHRIWSTEWYRNRDEEVALLVQAYEKALRADDSPSPRLPPKPGAPPHPIGPSATPSSEPKGRGASGDLRGLRPHIPIHPSITSYRQQELVDLAHWIASDGLLRSREELRRDMLEELPFTRMGPKIKAALDAAIEVAGLDY